jgi:hypothetical protein
MHTSATKCNETIGKWCKNKHGASKIIDTFETYHPSMNSVNFSGTRWISQHWAPAMQKKEYNLGEEGEALRDGALGPDAATEPLGLFLLPTGRPGHRFTVTYGGATIVGSLDLFLLPRGWPRPRFATCAPMSRCEPPASAKEGKRLERKP